MINNEKEYNDKLNQLNSLLDTVISNGGFDNMTEEQSDLLAKLSDEIYNYEESIYGEELYD